MDCHDAQSQMTAYLSGDLLAEDYRAVEAHVSSCQCCRVELDGYHQLWDALAAFPVSSPDPDLDRRILAQVSAELLDARTVPATAIRWWGIAVAALAAVALSIGNSVLLPYEVAFQWCSRTLRAYVAFADVSDTSFFLVVGIFYGLVPLLVVGLLAGWLLRTRPLIHGTAASLAFGVLILPYVLILCSALPAVFTLSLMGGIVLGALSGGVGGFWAGSHGWRLAH
jgi:predicted anti-sigma-YlaC factor YlaD